MERTEAELKEFKKANRVKVGYGQRLSECSYFGVANILVCCVLCVLLGGLVHYALCQYALYNIQNLMLEVLSQSHMIWVFTCGTLFAYLVVILWMFSRDTGDTFIIEVIKKVGKGKNGFKGYTLLGTDSYLVRLQDIEYYLQGTDKKEVSVTPTSLRGLEGINQNRFGYIYFKNLGDFCFSNDLKLEVDIDADEKENVKNKLFVLQVNHYRYKGMKLIRPFSFNQFTLKDNDGSVKEYTIDEVLSRLDGTVEKSATHSEYIGMKNKYIRRLYMADCFDYPEGLIEDFKRDAKSGLTRWCLGISALSVVSLVGMFAFYGDYRVSNFIQDFEYVGEVDGLSIYTDNTELHEQYSMYVVDSLKMLPGEIIKKAGEGKWSLVFVEGNIGDYGMLAELAGGKEMSGCTFPFYKLIVIKYPEVEASLARSFFMQTIIHEMGHFVSLDAKAMGLEWQGIYKEEYLSYMTNYARTNYSEGFASTFADYVMFNNALKGKSPKTTAYLNKVISSYIPE